MVFGGSVGGFGLAAALVLVAAIITIRFLQSPPSPPPVEQHAAESGAPVEGAIRISAADAPTVFSDVADVSLQELSCDEAALFAWMRAGGAFIHSGLALRSSMRTAGNMKQIRDADLGVYVNGTAISMGELLFSVPEIPLALSVAAVIGTTSDDDNADMQASNRDSNILLLEDIQLQLASTFIENEESVRRYLSLAVALLCEQRKAQRGASRWGAYLGCLPPVSACPVLVCFNKHERKALQDNFAAEAARSDQATLRRAYEAIDWVRLEGGCFERPPRKAEWLWAVGMVLSRAFTVDGVPRLLPFVDMLNHHPSAGGITIGSEDSPPPDETKYRNEGTNQGQRTEGEHDQQRNRKRLSLSTAVERVKQKQEKADGGDRAIRAGSPDRARNEMQEGIASGSSKSVSTWSKRALVPTGSEGRSSNDVDQLEDGAAVEWAYKSSEASNFDLLYLYGFVSAHPAHAFFPLRMEWMAGSREEAQLAHAIFSKADVDKTSRSRVEILSSASGPALALTLRFRSDGLIDPNTMAYGRIIAALSDLDRNRKKTLLHRAESITSGRLALPPGASPMGLANERSALQVLHSAASQLIHPQETTVEEDALLLATWLHRTAGGNEIEQEGAPSGRMVAAVQFRMQRKQAVSKTRRVAAGELDALSKTSGGWSP